MHVVIVSAVTPVRGGVSTWVNALARKLEKLGHEAKSINVAGEKGKDFQYLSATFTRMIVPLLESDMLFLAALMLAKRLVKKRAIREMKKNNYDVVNAQDFNAFNAVYKYCSQRKIKLILTVHGHLHNGGTATRSIMNDTFLNRYLFRAESEAYKKAEQIIVVSSYSYNLVKQYTSENRLNLIRNFVNIAEFYPQKPEERLRIRTEHSYNNNDFVLIYAGRLVKSKGISYVLEGVRRAVENKLPVRLIVCGDGPEKDFLTEFVKHNKLDSSIYFCGEVPKEKLLEEYNLADAFVMASVSDEGVKEGTPMALLEAMACGLPVMSTAVGGIGDIICHGQNAVIFEEKSGAAVFEAIKVLYENKELRKRIADQALREINERYSLEVVVKKIISVYQM